VRILFVSRLFHEISGGVERMAIVLMNELCVRNHAVELLSWDYRDAETYYPLDPRVLWHRLNMGDARDRAGWRLRLHRQVAIRRLLNDRRPDAVIAFSAPFSGVGGTWAGYSQHCGRTECLYRLII
jgi:hypothetical protein